MYKWRAKYGEKSENLLHFFKLLILLYCMYFHILYNHNIVNRCAAGGSMRTYTQRARVRLPVGSIFLGEVFLRVSLHLSDKCQEALGLLEWMAAWMECWVFHVRVVSEVPRYWADPSSGEASVSLCSQKKYACDPYYPPPTGRGSLRPGWRGSRKGTYKGEVKLR